MAGRASPPKPAFTGHAVDLFVGLTPGALLTETDEWY